MSEDNRYQQLATIVKQILECGGPDGSPISNRLAATFSGVSAATINSMMKGIAPSAANLRKFAEAFNVPPLALMEAAGYVPKPDHSPDEATLVACYRHMPPAKRTIAIRLMTALYNEVEYDEENRD